MKVYSPYCKVDFAQKRKDESFGINGENDVLNLLKCIHKKVVKTKHRYSLMDYLVYNENDKVILEYELKTRRVSSQAYPSFCFGENKLNHAIKNKENGIRTIFLFKLSDGLFCWEYDNSKVEEYYIGSITNKARNDLPHSACFVYTKYLKKLDIPKDVITWD